MCTGSLAGYNAVMFGLGLPLMILPSCTAIGDLIAYESSKVETIEGRKNRYTFAGAEYFSRMKEKGLYSIDNEEIKKRIDKVNLTDVFKQKLV